MLISSSCIFYLVFIVYFLFVFCSFIIIVMEYTDGYQRLFSHVKRFARRSNDLFSGQRNYRSRLDTLTLLLKFLQPRYCEHFKIASDEMEYINGFYYSAAVLMTDANLAETLQVLRKCACVYEYIDRQTTRYCNLNVVIQYYRGVFHVGVSGIYLLGMLEAFGAVTSSPLAVRFPATMRSGFYSVSAIKLSVPPQAAIVPLAANDFPGFLQAHGVSVTGVQQLLPLFRRLMYHLEYLPASAAAAHLSAMDSIRMPVAPWPVYADRSMAPSFHSVFNDEQVNSLLASASRAYSPGVDDGADSPPLVVDLDHSSPVPPHSSSHALLDPLSFGSSSIDFAVPSTSACPSSFVESLVAPASSPMDLSVFRGSAASGMFVDPNLPHSDHKREPILTLDLSGMDPSVPSRTHVYTSLPQPYEDFLTMYHEQLSRLQEPRHTRAQHPARRDPRAGFW